MLDRELFRASADEIHMRTLAQNLPCRANWITQALHATHASGPKRRTIHNQGIQLHLAVAIQKAASTRVEDLVVFHDDDRFLHSIKSRTAAFQHAPARRDSVAYAMQVSVHHVIGYGPGATVNHKNRISRQKRNSPWIFNIKTEGTV